MTKPLKRLPPTESELQARIENAQEWAQKADAKGQFPWDDANPKIVYGYPLKVKESLYTKLKFIVEREPNMSIQKFVTAAVEEAANAWIANHLNRGKNASK